VRERRPTLSIAVASLIALVVFGALAGLVLPRILGAAGGEEERTASRDPKRSLLFFLGTGAAAGALLTNVVAVAAAFTGNDNLSANAFPTAFIGITLGLVGYFMGARRLGIAAVVVTVVTLAVGAVVAGLL
jgi:hypothetical protein